MRVLWISNIVITDDLRSSGSWIFSMAHALLLKSEIILGNVIPFKTSATIRTDYKSIQQWKVPDISNSPKTVLNNRVKKNLLDIIVQFKPDIIHIWGIENGYALITPYVNCPVLVEIQGINSEIAKYFYADLKFRELIKLNRMKEIITFNNIFKQKKIMASLITRENCIFNVNKYFTTTTEWMRANVEAHTISAKFFTNGFILRDEFYKNKLWEPPGNKIILTSASTPAPYKGLHVLFEALKIVKIKFPKIQLHIIGPYLKRGFRTGGYIYFLLNKIRLLGLTENVFWLGQLNAAEICAKINESSVFVNSSFIESAGLTVLEAMATGIPLVTSYTGGIPALATNKALFFQPGDYKMMAFQIAKSLDYTHEIKSLTESSINYIKNYHNKDKVVEQQLRIYKSLIKDKSS